MSRAAFVSMCTALGCVVAMLVLDDTDASIRFGLAGIVFSILARVERRGLPMTHAGTPEQLDLLVSAKDRARPWRIAAVDPTP